MPVRATDTMERRPRRGPRPAHVPSLPRHPTVTTLETGDARPTLAAPRPPGPGVRPAMFVLLGAVVLFVGGAVGLALSGSTAPAPAPVTVRTAAGAPLRAAAAAALVKPITSSDQPPGDILSSLAVPSGTTAVAGSATDASEGTYDRSMRLRVPATQAKAISFFRLQLKSQGWTGLTSGPPSAALRATTGTIEVLGRHASEDGNYWEVGILVGPTVFPPGGAQFTPVTLQLYVVADEQ